MKRRHNLILALARTGLALASLAAASAQAQSTVTVFGILDVAARSVSNETRGSLKSLVSGANNTSRLGFRGSEDLGGGWSAGFHLEHGIAVDTGSGASANMFWDRRSTISLVSDRLGELRAGRDFVPTYTVWVRHDPFAYVGVGASSVLLGAAPTAPATGLGSPPTLRSSNAIQLLLPRNLGGFEGGLMVAAAEGGRSADGAHKLVSGRIGYAAGGFSAGLGYGETENDVTAGARFKDSVLGLRYDFGLARVALAQRQFKFRDSRQTTRILSATVPVGNHELKLSVLKADLDGRVGSTLISANDARHIALGYVHNLSKRTALYGTAARISNDGAATFAIAGGNAPAAGKKSTGLEAGLRHSF
jgi:predicted porin